MSSTFSIALSALQAESNAINTTGNNLANLNTTGFKGNAVSFKDLFSETVGGNPRFQTGLGVNVPVNTAVFSQGAVQASTSPYAAAINGNGFFIVDNQSGAQMFTRDGNFSLDNAGVLRTQTNEAIQGWTATDTGVNTGVTPSNITLPLGQVLAPRVTQNLSISANLDASAAVGSAAASVQVPVQVVDSLGNEHSLNFTFTKTAANSWTYAVSLPSTDGAVTAGGNGTLTFDSNGNLTNGGTVPVTLGGLSDGASDLTFNWNQLDGNKSPLITQYAQKFQSSSQQDGNTAAQLSGFSIQDGGQIVAAFNNGQQRTVAQIALANIQNPDSLINMGNNNYSLSGESAIPSIGVADTGGRGQIQGNSLEGSNVDIATQFTNLITYQSAYQAASRVITTENTITQDLFTIIR